MSVKSSLFSAYKKVRLKITDRVNREFSNENKNNTTASLAYLSY